MRNKASGFSLIEVLVAFTILTVSVGALLVAFSGGVRNTVMTRDYTQAVIIAESRLAETGITHRLSQEEESEGSDGDFSWKKVIRPLDKEPFGPWQLYEVSVSVTWKTLNGDRTFQLQSLRWGQDLG